MLAYKELLMQENELNKFPYIVSKVSSFVGNPVSLILVLTLRYATYIERSAF